MQSFIHRLNVATAFTVYGIETFIYLAGLISTTFKLQQHLPFTVLKLFVFWFPITTNRHRVATALTVYGIETYIRDRHQYSPRWYVATALTVYGIETSKLQAYRKYQ